MFKRIIFDEVLKRIIRPRKFIQVLAGPIRRYERIHRWRSLDGGGLFWPGLRPSAPDRDQQCCDKNQASSMPPVVRHFSPILNKYISSFERLTGSRLFAQTHTLGRHVSIYDISIPHTTM